MRSARNGTSTRAPTSGTAPFTRYVKTESSGSGRATSQNTVQVKGKKEKVKRKKGFTFHVSKFHESAKHNHADPRAFHIEGSFRARCLRAESATVAETPELVEIE